MNKLLFLGMTLSLISIDAARGVVITLTPTADSFVDALAPDTEFATGDLEAAVTGPVGGESTELTFLFAQFQMPDGMTGQDIASINSVDFVVRRSATAAKLSITYYVYGLFDGIDTDSADTYTWNDGVGYDPTHTLVKFPPDIDEISYFSDPGESAYIGSLDTSSNGPQDRPFGFVDDAFQGATALQNRADTILQDTDGRITLYMKCRVNFAVTPLQKFASLEHPISEQFPNGIAPPTLIIDFEPGSASIPGDYDGNGMVDGDDLNVWEGLFGQTGAALAADGDADEDVDGEDFLIWQRNLGAPGGPVAAVPEPAAASLALVGIVVMGYRWRRGAPDQIV